jgi:hypothetical protein
LRALIVNPEIELSLILRFRLFVIAFFSFLRKKKCLRVRDLSNYCARYNKGMTIV